MFEIRYQGLLTLASVTDPGGNAVERVVLYMVPNMTHVALLTVRDSDCDQHASDAGDYTGTNVRCYNLDGKTTITGGLSPGLPSAHLRGVISLNDPNVTRGSILAPRSEVGALTPVSNLFHLMEVPNGTLGVHNWFADQAVFNSVIYPMARTVFLTANASSDVCFSFFAVGSTLRKKVVVHPNATVYISNFPDPLYRPMPHFDVEAAFFTQTSGAVVVNNPAVIKTPPFQLGSADDPHDTCAVSHQLSVECSPSQFP